MNDVAVSRKQRLRTLENQIRKDYEAFVQTGFALMEIRNQELYKEDGFETWDAYLKQRVGKTFGIEQGHAFKMIVCAQVRTKVPDGLSRVRDNPIWSQRELLEFARLAPKAEDRRGQPLDFDRLSKRDVARVVNKVLAHCEKEGIQPTSTIVRKFVDADLGVNRAAQARETKQKREEESRPDLTQWLIDLDGTVKAAVKMLATVSEESWKLQKRHDPYTIERLIADCASLTDLLRRTEDERDSTGTEGDGHEAGG